MSEKKSAMTKIILAGPVEFSIHGSMVSALGDAMEPKYKLLVGKSGKRWVVGVNVPNQAESVYVDGGKGSEGFGGRTLTFELADGGSVDFIGPWKTTSDALFKDTGYDVRNTYFVRGIVGLRRENSKKEGWYAPHDFYDVLHYDEVPVLGLFDRIKSIAEAAAKEHGCRVFYSQITRGGGSASWADPGTVEKQP